MFAIVKKILQITVTVSEVTHNNVCVFKECVSIE